MHRGGITTTRERKIGPYLSVSARLETGNRKEKRAEANGRLRREQTFVSDCRMTGKEKTSPQRQRLKSNCIVFKVQEFLYKNTAGGLSSPKERRREEKAQTLGRRVNRSKIQSEIKHGNSDEAASSDSTADLPQEENREPVLLR